MAESPSTSVCWSRSGCSARRSFPPSRTPCPYLPREASMMGREAGEGAEIRSVGRALDLLEIMQQAAPAGIQVREAADQLGVDPATASRLLATLAAHGYASRLPNRRYTLGVRSLRLATAWVDRLLQLAGPIMARVADRCGETVYLLQLVGAEAVTL